MATTAQGKKAVEGTKDQDAFLKKIMDKLDPKTKKRLTWTMKNISRLEGVDRTYALASTFASILQDTGKLPGGLSREDFDAGIGTFDLAMNWNNLDSAQQFIQGGRQVIELANQYGETDIPYAGDALDLASIGYTQAQIINNWDKYTPVQKLIGLAHTYSNAGGAYNSFQSLTKDPVSTSLPGSQTAGAVAGAATTAYGAYQLADGWNEMDEVGRAGGTAATVSGGIQAYQGLQGVGAVGAEAGASAAATTAAGNQAGTMLSNIGTGAGYIAAAYGAYMMVDNWGTGGADGRANGAMAGMAMGTVGGPVGMAIGAAVGLAVGSISTGKSKEQGARDGYRDYFAERGLFTQYRDVKDKEGFFVTNGGAGGLFGDMHMMELADGSFYQVGVDGSGGRATYQGEKKLVSDPSKMLSRDMDGALDDNELRPYDIDYTNDLDFMTSHSLTGLKYIMGGGAEQFEKSGELGQMFGYMANGATSNVGSREFNAENFGRAMGNVRSMYANAGITTSDQAYNMLNQLKAEGKIDEEQFNAAGQSIRTAFNNDFEYASELNSTRWSGLENEMVGGQQDFVSNGEGAFDAIEGVTEKPTTGSFDLGKPVSTETAEDGINTVTTYEDGTQLSTLMGVVDQQPAPEGQTPGYQSIEQLQPVIQEALGTEFDQDLLKPATLAGNEMASAFMDQRIKPV